MGQHLNWYHGNPLLPTLHACRFYRLSSELVRAVMLGLDENGVDFSFRCGKSTHLLNCVRGRCTGHPTRFMGCEILCALVHAELPRLVSPAISSL